jgi:hypothetical protein
MARQPDEYHPVIKVSLEIENDFENDVRAK